MTLPTADHNADQIAYWNGRAAGTGLKGNSFRISCWRPCRRSCLTVPPSSRERQ